MSKKRYNNAISDKDKVLIGRAFGNRFYQLAINKFGSKDGIIRSGIVTERELYKLLNGTNPSLQKIFILAQKVSVRPLQLLNFMGRPIPGEEFPATDSSELSRNGKNA
jgi:hypothetical protein